MLVHLALLQTVSVPTLNESVKSVQQVGLATTLVLILVLFFLAWIGIIGWSIMQAMRSMVCDSAANATAQALTVKAHERLESQHAGIMDSLRRIETTLDRLIDRRGG